ncbi:hypothetical protein [Thalassotalea eurytherma]|uniref:Uncharacterized protein n=1 Tax=Thalassotalea eurytherma TaxID=1144278 RepID=A0ABQ6GZW7_9GAMM|nr:hypothetical protein [Thalassotalea eurytherma]GLX80887.1 hypothetical protein theurythT_03390 [Thalassotalea eurytherma]
MFANQLTMQKQTPVATTQAGGFWESFNTGLSGALDAWITVEQVKGAKSASGQDQIQAQVVPELENGAGVVRDTQVVQPTQKKSLPIEINQPLLIASLGLLGLALFMRANGAK